MPRKGDVMPQILQTATGDLLLLYPASNRLLFQRYGRDGLARPSIASENYSAGLSAVLFQENLYFSYLDGEDTLCFCHLGVPSPLRTMPNCKSSILPPRLLLFHEKLLLVYATETAKDGPEDCECSLCITAPLEEESSEIRLSLKPSEILSIATGENACYFVVSLQEENTLLQLSQDFCLIPCPSSRETRVLQANQDLTSALEQVKDENHTLTHSLELLEEDKQGLLKAIESAKAQYQELMGVAEQYRDEAAKWYQKYIRS